MTAISIFLTLVVLLAALAAGAWGVLVVHRRLSFLESECQRLQMAAIAESQIMERLVEDLTARLEATERRTLEATQRPAQSINYTQRSQMLRMARRGDAAEQIASTLGIALNQVLLLMKLPGVRPSRPAAGEELRAKAKTNAR